MGTTNGWAQGARVPLVAQVTAIVALGAGLVVAGVLRAAHDVPMAIALVTMGVAILPEAVVRVRRGVRERRTTAAAVASVGVLAPRPAAAPSDAADELVAA
ncbi:hypothetical protein J1G42_01480 [Cellulomonas sp. zg-ZUI222]|uniref:hypothetical protein n=1 Tax=Cellulomonas wangleii TaxID=2816956 RepID=UPI001A94B418|nr:hypothetical protein [Cellulomonas wangleii]MBO0919493.1 hypothetical protein [Cellulomonas wangleii]